MSRATLAYIVQLDLPGHPIKIGQSQCPLARFEHFSAGTPVDLRIVGLTLHGVDREKAMLDATASAKIKGEWRYATDELRELVASYHAAGEWFSIGGRSRDHMLKHKVRERIIAADAEGVPYCVTSRSVGYQWARIPLAKAALTDPLLHVHWSGFEAAESAPTFDWPKPRRLAA